MSVPNRLSQEPPPFEPEPGWVELPPWPNRGPGQPFLAGDPPAGKLRIRYFQRPPEPGIVGRVWFGPNAQGPPGAAHGGSIMAVLDEAMGACCWISGHPVVAGRLTTEFRNMLPLGTDTRIEAWIEKIEGRKLWARSRLTDEAGQLYAEAEALFIQLKPEQLQKIAERIGNDWTGPGA